MKNNGFTLIELLFTIVILALILAIAVPSVNGISNAIRESQRENNIERIEIAASKYAFDTGETLIFVDELVTEGYIESDDENGNIIDPVNNERLNCYVIEMKKVKDHYNATFIDDINYDNDGVCDLNKLKKDTAGINIEVVNNGTVISDLNNWIKGNVILNALIDEELKISCDNVNTNCVWSSSSGANSAGTSKTIDTVSGLLETKYIFQATVYDEEAEESIQRYTASINLKIDNEAPIIYNNELYVSNKFIYTDTKEIRIEASDGKGSGIDGYYLGLNNGNSCLSVDLEWQTSNNFTIEENGNYLICVKDKVGNISSYNGLTITYIN